MTSGSCRPTPARRSRSTAAGCRSRPSRCRLTRSCRPVRPAPGHNPRRSRSTRPPSPSARRRSARRPSPRRRRTARSRLPSSAVATDPAEDSREGVSFSNLDQPLFDGAGATKRDLVDYLDAMSDRIIPALRGRPLSVIRVHRGQEAFMQKNVPKYTPSWVQTVSYWAETSKREVSYALCDDRRTLLWFATQRAIEYHPTLVCADSPEPPTHLVLDLDPPQGSAFAQVVQAARLVHDVLAEARLEAVVKTSGAKGLHVFVPLDQQVSLQDAAAATRALAARAAARDPAVATIAFMKED